MPEFGQTRSDGVGITLDRPFHIGEWMVEPRLNRLSRDGESFQIELKMMDVLVCLAEHAGDLVERQQLIDTVWATEYITEKTLTRAVAELRRTLGDDAREPTYIETIHRKGYRLIAPVEVVEPPSATVTPFPTPAASRDDRSPYPGLAAFTEEDAEFFFGREAEVAALWRKITTRRLLAVIGPSGVGKSSFLRAGVIPAAPEGWGILICQPGEGPFAALARTLAPAFEGDAEAFSKATDFQQNALHLFTRWRQQNERAIVIVDQFEELFTLNPDDVQQRVADLLGALARDADIHVLLSMRDDFLYRCHAFKALEPVFGDLSPLRTPDLEASGRALREPAARLGYEFEDRGLVTEMVDSVGDERGALPMLAFAVARLWDKRDRERNLLTRQAYNDIGGVAGALARHAEATIDRVGSDRISIVREIFRNLVTAEGTRAVREWDELLSVFCDSSDESPEEVLRQLIDARLLTSYEVQEEDKAPTRVVEVVHESLLANWPRLVRWQTQDADATQLRDQLRQAAKTWDEHGRSDDMLWTGSGYREFAVWRERYPGGLTELEEAFATAMTSLASRRRRRRRIAVTAGFIILVAVLAVVGSLWQRSVLETRRAESAKLLALGELELEAYPTAALAWATSSLELADTSEGRALALRALGQGPPLTILERELESDRFFRLGFSSAGRWLVSSQLSKDFWGQYRVQYHDGTPPITIGTDLSVTKWSNFFLVKNDTVITDHDGVHRWWDLAEADHPFREEHDRGRILGSGDDGYFSVPLPPKPSGAEIVRWPADAGPPRLMGQLKTWHVDDIDDSGKRFLYRVGNDLLVRSLVDWDSPPQKLASTSGALAKAVFSPNGERVAFLDGSDRVRVWKMDEKSPVLSCDYISDDVVGDLAFDASGRALALHGYKEASRTNGWLIDLEAPKETAPLELRRSEIGYPNQGQMAAHPSGHWMAISNAFTVGFWPLTHTYPWVLPHTGRVFDVAFTPDNRWLLTVTSENKIAGGAVRAWPLEGQNGGESRVLLEQGFLGFLEAKFAMHPSGDLVAVGSCSTDKMFLISLSGAQTREFSCSQKPHDSGANYVIAFSPTGKTMAVVPNRARSNETSLEIWDLETGESTLVGPVSGVTAALQFLDEDLLRWTGGRYYAEGGGEIIFNLTTNVRNVLSEQGRDMAEASSADGSLIFTIRFDGESKDSHEFELYRTDAKTNTQIRIDTHGSDPAAVSIDPSSRWIATGGVSDGIVRVGPATGREPLRLYGHEGWIHAVKFSPDGRWIATAADDNTVRLWPMPDLSKPPLHTLPHDELIAKLKSLTNLRAVRDEESSTRWKIEVGPFPGWAEVPEW